jgi:uncharacterized protein YkwD
MKASSSADTPGATRSVRRTGKVIPLPTPRRRRHRAARVATVVVALGVIGAMTAHINGWHNGRMQTAAIQSPFSAPEFQLLKLCNDNRIEAGLAPLQFSPRLMVAARNHSRDMAARGYLGQDSPAGATPADRARAAGLDYDEIAENVYRADAVQAEGLPKRVITAWLQSPAYRGNLLSPAFRLSAVGIARAEDGDYFVTQDFIR